MIWRIWITDCRNFTPFFEGLEYNHECRESRFMGRMQVRFLHCSSLLVQRAPRIEVWNPNTVFPILGLGNSSKSLQSTQLSYLPIYFPQCTLKSLTPFNISEISNIFLFSIQYMLFFLPLPNPVSKLNLPMSNST